MDRAVGVTTSPLTFQTQVVQFSGQRWLAEVGLPLMLRAAAEEWVAFFGKLDGQYGTFLMGDPNGGTPRGVATGTPLVKGASQTGNSLITDGWTISITNILRAGDYIQIGTGLGAQLYKVLNDANSDGAGDATFDIWPNLRSSPVDNAPVIITNTVGLFRLQANKTPWDINEAAHYGIAFSAAEAL